MKKVKLDYEGVWVCHTAADSWDIVRHPYQIADDGRLVAYCNCYDEAIEYRGEAYLGLNRLNDAKTAYMQLFQFNRPLADQLIAAMTSWVAARRDDAGTLDAAVVEEFAAWVEERRSLASYIYPLDDTERSRWTESG